MDDLIIPVTIYPRNKQVFLEPRLKHVISIPLNTLTHLPSLIDFGAETPRF